ncbi:Hypothetical predicted protein [Mytilus galloprovincialis]|uniref:Uncharacterized protein n=2 Tax=Mytilus galloprovincialis TaxID=29158 RepID=A0A8B6GC55_MYTGA|nr:Hypothetical predicted protein [Mytilus galloprovincialis]
MKEVPILLLALIVIVVGCNRIVNVQKNAKGGNMNGRYLVASGGNQAVPFNDDYMSKGHEYFDVYSPEIATHYGEVFWTDQGNNLIPQEIIDRFAGKVMAITGYEQDQVMVYPLDKPGLNPENDVSVPINWAYNHHYMAWMTGNHSKLVKIQNPDPSDVSAHGSPMKWVAVDLPSAKDREYKNVPTSQMFSEGNGGESRKSFHGYPDGFAQLIDSPDKWHITPMQIDTRNRDCGATPQDVHNCTVFTPGDEPRQARYGRGIPKEGAIYSGILECPCNGRFGGDPAIYGPSTKTKYTQHHYALVVEPSCKTPTKSATICFDAVANLGVKATKNVTMVSSSSEVPSGCSVDSESDGLIIVSYNEFKSSKQCSTSSKRTGNLKFSTGVSIKIELSEVSTITLSGPADAWFGVGFNATHMADKPYTLIVNSTGVYKRQIGTCGSEADHCPGTPLKSSIKIVSNTVVDGVRTAVLTRPLKGLTKEHYSFNALNAQINFISAIGSSQVFAYHKVHTTGIIALITSNEPNCICEVGETGMMCDNNGSNCDHFVKNCVPAPAGELLSQRNPTCNSMTYAGGLQCCKHKRIMLDADQPIRPELLRYHMKFRFWFQEYKVVGAKVSHHDLPRIYYQTEAWAGEYDIPPAFALPGKPIPGYNNWPLNTPTPGTKCTGNCPSGDDCECVHTIEFKWTVSNIRLIYAGGHCHAPACIAMELYRNDTGHEMELLCRQVPVFGKGNIKENKYDEAGYIALPPCLWGDDTGLEPSVLLPKNTPMVAIKHNRNTKVGHFGEMASWQMRGVNF